MDDEEEDSRLSGCGEKSADEKGNKGNDKNTQRFAQNIKRNLAETHSLLMPILRFLSSRVRSCSKQRRRFSHEVVWI